MELEVGLDRSHQSDVGREGASSVAPARLARRPAPGGVAPVAAAPLQLRASGFAAQLFADAVSAGVHPAEQVQRAAAHGLSGGSSALPHLSAIQHSFGRHDVSGVAAHVGGRAAEGAAAMGAHGYASGNAVAFASAPDLHLAAHEAAHVVQQRAGVHLKGGVGEVGDAYERHADAVADLVVQGQSAESLLDHMAPGGGGGGVQRAVVQRREVMAMTTQLGVQHLQEAFALATPAEATAMLATLRPLAVSPQDPVVASLSAGGNHYQLTLPRATIHDLVAAPPAPQPHGSHARTDVQSQPNEFTQDIGGAMVALCAGTVGTERVASIHLGVPTPSGVIARFQLELRVGHEAEGFHVEGGLRLGAAIGFHHIAEAALMVGVSVDVTGATPARAAELVIAAIRSSVAALWPEGAAAMFGAGLLEHDSHLREGEETDAGASLAIEGSVGHEGSAQITAAAGISEHVHREAGSTEAETYRQWDLQAGLSIGHGFEAHVEAHLPVDPHRAPDIDIVVKAKIPRALQDVLRLSTIDALNAAVQRLDGAGDNPHAASARESIQLALGACSSIGEDAVRDLIPASGTAKLELTFALGGESPHLQIALLESLLPEPAEEAHHAAEEAAPVECEIELESARSLPLIPIGRPRGHTAG